MRFAIAVMGLLLAGPLHAACAEGDGNWIKEVCFGVRNNAPVYGHNVLGNTPEWSQLQVDYGRAGQAETAGGRSSNIILLASSIIEDIAPRLVDLNGDSRPEAIIVESDFNLGARLAVIEFIPEPRLAAATPYIGTRNRWLAPIGAADLDGDGYIEIAYIDRPHLARTLRVWRFKDDELTEVTAASGLTNHRIGEDYISGGIRDCGQGPEMITADANWTNIMATRLVDGQLRARIVGPHEGRASFDAALSC